MVAISCKSMLISTESYAVHCFVPVSRSSVLYPTQACLEMRDGSFASCDVSRIDNSKALFQSLGGGHLRYLQVVLGRETCPQYERDSSCKVSMSCRFV